jgi:ribonucleotide reductase alpha subunit
MFGGMLTGQCAEIVEYHDTKSIASCNLASISLPSFIQETSQHASGKKFNYAQLGEISRLVCESLNCVIDRNTVPVPSALENNRDYRPIGIGVQGLADVFIKLRLTPEDPETRRVNQVISEVIYYNALWRSSDLAQRDGSYVGFENSPTARGILQYDYDNIVPITSVIDNPYIVLDWNRLKEKIKSHGLRNSLTTAYMPTGSTSQILNNPECFEFYTSNMFVRNVLSGNYPIVNINLYEDLNAIGLWTKSTVNDIIRSNGSIQSLEYIPVEIRKLYKTVWEISQKLVVELAADRGHFIDQSQSMNIYMTNPTTSKLTSLYLDGWRRGLKTLSYYVRSQPAADPIKFSLKETAKEKEVVKEQASVRAESDQKQWTCDDGTCCSG